MAPGEGVHGGCVGKLKQAAPVTLLLPSLPSLPSAVAEWLPPTAWGAIGVFLAVNRMETKAGEARLNQRMDEVKEEFQASEARIRDELKASEARIRDELKASEARVRDELKASEARQAQRTDELRADMNRQMADLRTDMNRQMADFRADNRVLGEKMDRLLELFATVKQT